MTQPGNPANGARAVVLLEKQKKTKSVVLSLALGKQVEIEKASSRL